MKGLFFYVIAADWMHRAWPILRGSHSDPQLSDNWREELIGRIVNEQLLNISSLPDVTASAGAIYNSPLNGQDDIQRSKVNELAKKAKTLSHNPINGSDSTKLQTSQQKCYKIRRDAADHFIDYFLVGSNVWLLLKEKFGYDYEVKLRCQYTPPRIAEWCLEAVVLDSEDVKNLNNDSPAKLTHLRTVTVPIPLSGRFPYENLLSSNGVSGDMAPSFSIGPEYNPVNGPLNQMADEVEDAIYAINNQANASASGNNVSDDDDDYDTGRDDASHRLQSSVSQLS